MRAAEKEVEQLEKKYLEDSGLPMEPDESGKLTPIQLPKHRLMIRQKMERDRREAERRQKELEDKVNDLSTQISNLQGRLKLKQLNEGASIVPHVSPDKKDEVHRVLEKINDQPEEIASDAPGPGGDLIEFPQYDGAEPPVEWKKPFTQFCIRMRKEVKQSLSQEIRKDKAILNETLKDRWTKLSDDDKAVWREWTEWDKRRYSRDLQIFERIKAEDDMKAIHVPKKRKDLSDPSSIPKRNKL